MTRPFRFRAPQIWRASYRSRPGVRKRTHRRFRTQRVSGGGTLRRDEVRLLFRKCAVWRRDGVRHAPCRPGFARRIFEFVLEAREVQDNEQWHLLILEELVEQRSARRSFFKACVVPQILALVYYHLSWLLYVVSPRSSYALNAGFEEHAEHGNLAYVVAHPELELAPWLSRSAVASIPAPRAPDSASGLGNAASPLPGRMRVYWSFHRNWRARS